MPTKHRGKAAQAKARNVPIAEVIREQRGPGRPRLGTERREQRNISITPADWEFAVDLGGTASEGIHIALEMAKKTQK